RHLGVEERQLPCSLVDPLVAAAEEQKALPPDEVPQQFLIESLPVGRQKNGPCRRTSPTPLDRGRHHGRRHDHPGSPAERLVIDSSVFVFGKLSQVGDGDGKEPRRDRLAEKTRLERRLKVLGENREDLYVHRFKVYGLRSKV